MRGLGYALRVHLILALAICWVLILVRGGLAGCPGCPPDDPTRGKVVLTCFYLEGDPESARAISLLRAVVANSGSLELVTRDMSLPEVRELRKILDTVYEVREGDRMRAPAVFVGKDAFVGYDAIREGVRSLAVPQPGGGKGVSGRVTSLTRAIKLSGIFSSGGLIAPVVTLAGLVDGVNPCALYLLIFLIACLSLGVSGRRSILTAGMSFISGAFVAYFAIGLGVLRLVNTPFFENVSRWLYPSLGALTFLLGGFSLLDYFRARAGRPESMKLQLPSGLKRITHKLVRDYTPSAGANVVTGFSLGFVASLFEFPCTGQVYLPTIALIGTPLSGIRSFLYLFLYNVMFVIPLVAVVMASAYFLSAKRVAGLFSRGLAGIKLVTACLFFLLSAYMFGVL